MATDNDLQKSVNELLFKCSSGKQGANVVCINCRSASHVTCANNKKFNLKHIKGFLVKCCEGEFTSNISISSDDLKTNYTKIVNEYNKLKCENQEIKVINKLNKENLTTLKEQNETQKKLNK